MELRKSLFRWRSAWIYLIALAPVFIVGGHALFDHHSSSEGMREDIVILAGIFQLYYLRLAIFFGCLGIFTRLIRGEMVERSLHYYLLAPVRRELLVIAKFIAGVFTSITVFATAVFMCTAFMYLHFGHKGMLFLTEGPGAYHMKAYLGITVLACLGYGAVFLALSMVFKNPIVPAILFFGWEAINPVMSPLMQKLSITFYLRHLSPVDVPAEGVFALLTVVAEPVPAWAASLGVVALTAGVLLLACYRVRKLEISYTTE
jgi:ABC-type transport system involved in multi-copper enzyme maturation permease subunit